MKAYFWPAIAVLLAGAGSLDQTPRDMAALRADIGVENANIIGEILSIDAGIQTKVNRLLATLNHPGANKVAFYNQDNLTQARLEGLLSCLATSLGTIQGLEDKAQCADAGNNPLCSSIAIVKKHDRYRVQVFKMLLAERDLYGSSTEK